MASPLPSTATATALQQNIKSFCNKPTSHTHLFSLTCFSSRHSLRCSAFQIGDLLHSTNLDGSLSELPVFQSGMSLVHTVTDQFPEQENVPETCAEFLGSFIADKTNSQFSKGGKWLVWKFEGDLDLADYMRDRSFPVNLENVMFGRVLKGLNSIERNALIIKQIMRQIITSLKKIHNTGIVHRDVKPANLVVTKKGQIKLIDFGAATDLRIGKNFVPDRGLLDPDFCPPDYMFSPRKRLHLRRSRLLLFFLQYCGSSTVLISLICTLQALFCCKWKYHL